MNAIYVEDLSVCFKTFAGNLYAVDQVSFHVEGGERVAIVGESGSGKSATALTLMGMQAKNAKPTASTIKLFGQDVLSASKPKWQQLRRNSISMIFQDPMTALNPTMPIGRQILEAGLSSAQEVVQLLRDVGMPDPKERMHAYPYQLSGGMRQRVMIAIALAKKPKLLIADEPTTALDVTIQADILDLLLSLQKKNGMSILLITHDLGIVASFCERVIVMYAGQIVEEGSVNAIYTHPRHPYTKALIQAVPRPDRDALYVLEGRPPDPTCPPEGCRFAERCPAVMEICQRESPPRFSGANCWLHDERTPRAHKEAHLG